MPQLDTQQKEYEEGFYRLEDIPKHLRKYFIDKPGYSFNFKGIAKELYRITKDGGVVVWVVGDATVKGSETGTSFKQALYFKEIGFNLHDTMIYKKDGISFPDAQRYYGCFEYMFILSKGTPKSINQIKDLKNKHFGATISGVNRNPDGSTKKMSCSGNKIKEYGVRWNVWEITPQKTNRVHPAMFPEKLAQDHILSWSNKGDLILDPMNGSGTTTKMAQKLNRNYIGIDCSKEYCKIAEDRLRQQTLNYKQTL